MYSIDFIKLETHGKVSFHRSDFWLPILPASATYKKDGAQRHHNFRQFRHFSALLSASLFGGLGTFRFIRVRCLCWKKGPAYVCFTY